MKGSERERKREKRILLHFIGISLSYIIMVGGLLIFILLIVGVNPYLLGGLFSAYLSIATILTMTFLYTPIRNLDLRKYFIITILFFLSISITLILQWIINFWL